MPCGCASRECMSVAEIMPSFHFLVASHLAMVEIPTAVQSLAACLLRLLWGGAGEQHSGRGGGDQQRGHAAAPGPAVLVRHRPPAGPRPVALLQPPTPPLI